MPGNAAGESEKIGKQVGGTSHFARVRESAERHADQDLPADAARSEKGIVSRIMQINACRAVIGRLS